MQTTQVPAPMLDRGGLTVKGGDASITAISRVGRSHIPECQECNNLLAIDRISVQGLIPTTLGVFPQSVDSPARSLVNRFDSRENGKCGDRLETLAA